MANITLRKTTEPSRAMVPPMSSFPSSFGRVDPLQWMENFFRWDPFREMFPALGRSDLSFTPDFEIQETQDRYVFVGDLPGLTESDIELSVSGNRLTISGKREAEQKVENGNYYCQERSYGSFSRSFTLPAGADLEHIKADLKNGVLTVDVAKMAEAQPRKIALGAGDTTSSKQARA